MRIAGEVRDFDVAPFLDPVTREIAGMIPRNVQFGMAATQMAVEDSQLTSDRYRPERLGISVGAYTTCINLAHAAPLARTDDGS